MTNGEWTYLGEEEELKKILLSLGYSQNKIKIYFSHNELKRKIFKKSILSLPLNLINHKDIFPAYFGPLISVIHDDNRFLVLDKPWGVHGHPLSYLENNTCLNFIRSSLNNDYQRILKVDKDKAEKGMLYRLDKETSGVLIFCKNQDVYEELRNKFDLVAKEKIYGALVKGRITKQSVQSFIYYSGENNLKAHSVLRVEQVPHSKKSFVAHLDIISTEYLEAFDLTFVMIHLKEGLRHQIRVQLAMLEHPILGDELYGEGKKERLFLHAYRYSLELKNEKICFTSNSFPMFEKYFKKISSFFP